MDLQCLAGSPGPSQRRARHPSDCHPWAVNGRFAPPPPPGNAPHRSHRHAASLAPGESHFVSGPQCRRDSAHSVCPQAAVVQVGDGRRLDFCTAGRLSVQLLNHASPTMQAPIGGGSPMCRPTSTKLGRMPLPMMQSWLINVERGETVPGQPMRGDTRRCGGLHHGVSASRGVSGDWIQKLAPRGCSRAGPSRSTTPSSLGIMSVSCAAPPIVLPHVAQ